jgi:transposase
VLRVETGTARVGHRVQVGKGRPGKNTQYELRIQHIYTLTWHREPQALKAEARVDSVFPLLSTDLELSSKAVLQAYKYQPRLEKRFAQFKSIHHAAPLLFKKVTRIEANLFLFFIALMLQALLEREVRNAMVAQRIKSIPLYPEEREASRPTTSKILDLFERVSTYAIVEHDRVVEEFKDELTDTQRAVRECLAISEDDYWLPK